MVETILTGLRHFHTRFLQELTYITVIWIDSMKNVVAVPEDEIAVIGTSEEVVKKYMEELLVNLSVIISILNPGRIYIGGDLPRYGSIISDASSAPAQRNAVDCAGTPSRERRRQWRSSDLHPVAVHFVRRIDRDLGDGHRALEKVRISDRIYRNK